MEKVYGYIIYHKGIANGGTLPEWKPYPSHKIYQTRERALEAIKNIREVAAENWGNKYKLLKVYTTEEFEPVL